MISFSAEELDFGDVLDIRPKTLPIQIENPGTDDLILNYIAFSTTVFNLNPAQHLPMNIPPGGNAEIDVEFTPEANSEVSALMIVNSNAENGETMNIPLHGRGHIATGFTTGSLSDEQLSFSLSSGETEQASVSLINSGLEDLNFNIQAIPVQSPISSVRNSSVSNNTISSNPQIDLFKREHRKGELIVAYKNSNQIQANSSRFSQHGMKLKKVLSKAKNTRARNLVGAQLSSKKHIVLLESDGNTDLRLARKQILQDPNVAYVEPNYIVKAIGIPDDSDFSRLYGMHNTGQTGGTVDADIDAPEAWNIFRGNANLKIGVIDTGIDYNHPDIQPNMWTNPGEIPGNGVDDDNNGYIDDVYGYDFINNDGDPMDDHSHGTHCAGTIAGAGNNGQGVAGVVWNAKLIGLKFLSAGGSGSIADAVEAVLYANAMGITITSNSWGGGGYSQAMADALSQTNDLGYLFIAAAGNSSSNNDSFPHYPSSYEMDAVIAVAATDHNDNRSSFSSYGLTSVDLGAPGTDVYSTVLNGQYASYSGTSMATPHVAGVAALLKGFAPQMTGSDIKESILESTDPISALDGLVLSGGRLNAFEAIKTVRNRWFVISPLTGTIPGNSSLDLDIDINTDMVTAGQHSVDVQFHINDRVNPVLHLDVQLEVTGTPIIQPSDNNLAFGQVWLGRSHGMPLTIKNIGAETLSIQSMTFDNAEFSLPNDLSFPLQVEGFAEVTVDVSYTPTLNQVTSATLNIVSNASNAPQTEVALNGQGILAPNLEVDREAIELTLAQGSSTTETLQFQNTGEAPLDYSISILEQNSASGTPSLLQTGGPDLFGHYWTDSDEAGGPLYQWNEISTTGTRLAISDVDDGYDLVQLSGFTFSFYGTAHSSFYVSSNGYITFGFGASQYSNYPLPSTNAPTNLIAGFFDDLNPSQGGNIYVLEEAGKCTVQFEQVEFYTTTDGPVTFQMVLHANGKINYYYKSGMSNSLSSTVGIQNQSANDGLNIVYNAAYLRDEFAIQIQDSPEWINLPVSNGSIAPGGIESVNVDFLTQGIDVGEYRAVMRIQTNYSTAPVELPIVLTVDPNTGTSAQD